MCGRSGIGFEGIELMRKNQNSIVSTVSMRQMTRKTDSMTLEALRTVF
jgi:hypothetical protein